MNLVRNTKLFFKGIFDSQNNFQNLFNICMHSILGRNYFFLMNIYFRGELLRLSMIENVHKKKAHDKDSRLATVMVSYKNRQV